MKRIAFKTKQCLSRHPYKPFSIATTATGSGPHGTLARHASSIPQILLAPGSRSHISNAPPAVIPYSSRRWLHANPPRRGSQSIATNLNLRAIRPHLNRVHIQALFLSRSFHSSRRNQDVFFFAFPALKAHLLSLTRICLVILPFVYRYRLWKKYPRMSLAFLNIPIFAVCIVIALALDQSPRTQRWRLLLMTGREELEWARRRFDDFLRSDGPLLLKDDDPRVQQVQKVTERLINAIDDPDQERHIVSYSHKIWPPPEPLSATSAFSSSSSSASSAMHLADAERIRVEYPPSAKACGTIKDMPFMLESSNPDKVFETSDWKLYVVDLPRINAFALPTREIVVYTGLIDLLEDDTLLSAVLAHEISHVVQRHAVENVSGYTATFMNVANITFDILRGISFAFTMSFPVVSDAAAAVFNVMNDHLATRAFSRKLEEEADTLGMEFMASAGYDPRGAIDLWEVMALVEEDAAANGQAVTIQDRMTLLRTHPTSIQRQKNLTKLLPKAMELYRKSPFRTRKLEDEMVPAVNAPTDTSSATTVTAPPSVASVPADKPVPVPEQSQ
ncbi:hypothetical protein DL93DRAFT_2145179 [Clavulina sp. PMI_390]|nr:hypothetical protein DL93DRAFT_2145179 [Clavulina sp. PMI_390]